MARLTLEGVTKSFDHVTALQDISLQVEDGEFVAILGPSGCGKTTLLRAIAGFEKITQGQIKVGERLYSSPNTYLPPEQRQIGIVFQNYALWPHMSVAENVGYSLKIAKVPRLERDKRIREALALVDMADLGERRPAELSGGQRQRVALARCLVRAPSLVLFDEPLANLDVHLRAAMEDEFAAFHQRTGNTILYITHDQAEAMALADRIAVIDQGRLRQFGSPRELYNEPQNEMVARFIAGGMVLPVTILSHEAEGFIQVELFGQRLLARCQKGEGIRQNAHICLHASDIDCVDTEGIALQLTRVVYRSGQLQIAAHPLSDPSLHLRFTLADNANIASGQRLNICIKSGWIIPARSGAECDFI